MPCCLEGRRMGRQQQIGLAGWPLHFSRLPLHLGSRRAFLGEGSKPDVPSWLISWVPLRASTLGDAILLGK